MYADRYARPAGIRLGNLTIAVAINAGLLAALALSTTVTGEEWRDKALKIVNIRADPPPPEPIPPRPLPKTTEPAKTPPARIDRVDPVVKTIAATSILPPLPPLPPFNPGTGTGTGTGTGAIPAQPVAPPVLTDPAIDPRYARDFQPDYPAGERRLGAEGKVVIRVLVGVDGRVRQVERVTAASDAFWRATAAQALARWRFRPATRDGVPIAAWRTLTVRFEMVS